MILFTVSAGPTLTVWRDGQEVARAKLGLHAVLELVQNLLRELRASRDD